MWRVLTHERNRATLHEVETYWSLEDLALANLALNASDELQQKAAEAARAQADARR